MNVEDFIRKELRASLVQGGGDMVMINNTVETCIFEYRQRSSFKPDVMTYLIKRANQLVKQAKKNHR